VDYKHTYEQAQTLAGRAMERIAKEGLIPNPHIFELWYVYYSGQSPEITRAIDVLETNKQQVTQKRCDDLYERLLSNVRNEKAVRAAGDQISSTIRTVSGAVTSVKMATSQYSTKLQGVNQKMSAIGDNSDPSVMREILSGVMQDTDQMMEQNRKLEEELTNSSNVMAELQNDLEEIRKEALTDGLTGLSNRKAFDSELERIASESRASGHPFCLMMLDIDHFKTFNDNFGHQIGDQVLKLVAKTMHEGIKGKDFAARYGGEEFVILLPQTPLKAALTVADALRRAVASKDVVNRSTGESLGRITLSVGAAEYFGGEDLEGLIERADSALYTAKHNGRNQIAAAPTPSQVKKMAAEQAEAGSASTQSH
jgi:diguanylate cyclase